jgi:6-pyruvoyl-tetrahydropterin synthase
MILLTRKAEFSSAHFYWNDSWSQQENERVFGKCANRNGHGHNYTLEVTVAGEIDPVTGFVVHQDDWSIEQYLVRWMEMWFMIVGNVVDLGV